MGALDGLKIVDLSRLLPGPFCTALLADHGADVIMVEAPRFREDKTVGEVPMMRRNKRHMALDLKSDEGKEVFFALVAGADVLVEAYRPGVVDDLGVGYDTVSALNPGIVYCSLTGYGQTGPLADRAAHDLNLMAAAGILDLMRDKDGTPVIPTFQIAGLAGSLYAALGIMMALTSRAKTGVGQHIDAAMTDGLISLLAMPLSFSFTGSVFPGRVDTESPDWFPCYRVYETRDGKHLSVGPLEPHLWESLCTKLDCQRYAKLQYDRTARREIEERLEQLFRTKDLQEWQELLNDRNDCTAPVTKVEDLPHDAHVKARNMIHLSAAGIPEPGITPLLSATPGSFRRPAYCFGEHTHEILEELGYAGDRIKALHDQGVIWKPDG